MVSADQPAEHLNHAESDEAQRLLNGADPMIDLEALRSMGLTFTRR